MWPWLLGGLGTLVALIVVAVLTSSGGVKGLGGTDRLPLTIIPGDEVVHADEISTTAHTGVPPFIAPLPNQPQRGKAYVIGRDPAFYDADDSLIIGSVEGAERDLRILVGYDPATGHERFRTPLPKNLYGSQCALAGVRIGCVLSGEGMSSDLIVYDATTGREVAVAENLDQTLHIVGIGDNFVLSTQTLTGSAESTSSSITAYGPDAKQLWNEANGLILDSVGVIAVKHDDSSVDFRRISDDGLIVKTAPYAPVTVHTTGIAVGDEKAGRTDFVGFDGKKVSSIRGWLPVLDYARVGTVVPAIPLLGRAEQYRRDTHIIGAANPATGHLLWRKTGSEFFADIGSEGRQAGPLLVIPAGTPGRDVSKKSRERPTDERWHAIEPFTGQVRSGYINTKISEYDERLTVSDGARLIICRNDELVAHSLATGVQTWRIGSVGCDYRQVGNRLVDTQGGGADLR